jgi:hypothetical protein
MALTHEIQTEIGIPAVYFHINRIDCYPRDRVFDLGVKGFISEDARLSGSENIYVFSKRYEYPEGVTEITQESAYALLKQEPEFIGAQDA